MDGRRRVPVLPQVWIWTVMVLATLVGLGFIFVLMTSVRSALGGHAEAIVIGVVCGALGVMMLWLAGEEWAVWRWGRSPTAANGLLMSGALLMLFVTALLTFLSFQRLEWGTIGVAVMTGIMGLFLFFGAEFNERWWLHLDAANRRKEPLCTGCGYDLRATPDPWGPVLERCPECGRVG